MPETPLSWISYANKGESPWYTEANGIEGLEQWLATIELLGIPTYATFSDLPTAGSTNTKSVTGGTQRQFAAVVEDGTIYRDDGTQWVAWMNYYTDADAVAAVNNDADHGSTASHNYFSGSHNDLSNVASDDHHSRYSDSEAVTAVNNDADHGSTASHNYFSGSHNDLSNVGSSDHHTKTTSLADITDADPSEIATGTLANRPTAGSAGRWYLTTDNNGIYYDDGTNWQLIAEHPSNISAGDLGFDPATQTELNNHAGTSNAHHSRYTDSEAVTAINNDTDHGSTASHNYFSGSHNDLSNVGSSDHHAKYTNSEARNAVTGNVNVEDLVTASATAGQVARSQGDGTLLMEALSHGDLSGISSNDHHSRYSDSEAISAINNDADHGSTASHNYFSGSHNDLTNVGASDHHTKTTSLADITDADPSEILAGTLANQPAAGNAGRWYLTTDNNGIYYDDGTNWQLIAEHPANISAGDLGFDPATQSELDSHAGNASAHHSRYTDSEATTAVGGSTPWANSDLSNSSVTVAGNSVSLGGSASIAHADLSSVSSNDHHAKYTDSEARTAVTGNVNVEDLVTASATAGQVARSQGDGTLLMEALSHGDLSGVSSNDHHSRYSDSEAISAINNDADHGSTASHNYFSGSHNDLSNVASDDHHTKYTDSEAVSAVNAETSLSVDISGDADSVDGYQGADLAALGEAETITNNWTFEREAKVLGTSATEDSGDAVMAVQAGSAGLDGHFRWYAPDGGNRATMMYDSDANTVRIWDYVNGRNLVRFPIGSGDGSPNFPIGLRKEGNQVLDETQVTSGTNASGNYELTVQGDTYEFVPQ